MEGLNIPPQLRAAHGLGRRRDSARAGRSQRELDRARARQETQVVRVGPGAVCEAASHRALHAVDKLGSTRTLGASEGEVSLLPLQSGRLALKEGAGVASRYAVEIQDFVSGNVRYATGASAGHVGFTSRYRDAELYDEATADEVVEQFRSLTGYSKKVWVHKVAGGVYDCMEDMQHNAVAIASRSRRR